MAEQKLTGHVEIKGADQAAKDVGKVVEAEAKLGKQTDKTTEAAKEAAAAQEKLQASEETYVSLLSRIHPSLGALADGLLKGSKVAGDLASKNIDLAGTFKSLTATIKNNANALKLIGAGGAVVLAINLITQAMARMKEEADRVEESIRRQIDALNELARSRAERREETERLSVRRHEGPVTAEESARLDALVEQIGDIAGTGARQRAVLLAGPEASLETLRRLSVVLDQFQDIDFEQVITRPLDVRLRLIERILERRASALETIFNREAVQKLAVLPAALAETRAAGTSTMQIEEFIKQLPGKSFEGIDTALLAKVVAGLAGIGKTSSPPPWSVPWLMDKALYDQMVLGQSGQFVGLEVKQKILEAEGVKGATPELIRLAEFVLTQLNKAADRLEGAAENLSERTPANVTINQQNSRFIGPDAASKAARTINGETLLRRRELI